MTTLPRHPCLEYPNPCRGGIVFSRKDVWTSSSPVRYPYATEHKSGRARINLPFFEFRGVGPPSDNVGTSSSLIQHCSFGDTYLECTPGAFKLWVRLDTRGAGDGVWTPGRKWKRWPGVQPDNPILNDNADGSHVPFDRVELIPHPYIPDRFLWSDGKSISYLATNTIEIARRTMRKAGVFDAVGDGAASASTPWSYGRFTQQVTHRVLSMVVAAEKGESTVITQAVAKRRRSEKRDRTGEALNRKKSATSNNADSFGDEEEAEGEEEEDMDMDMEPEPPRQKGGFRVPSAPPSKRQKTVHSTVSRSPVNGSGFVRRTRTPAPPVERPPPPPPLPTDDLSPMILNFHTTVTSRDQTIQGRDITISQADGRIKAQSANIHTNHRQLQEQANDLAQLEGKILELQNKIGRRNIELDAHIAMIQSLTSTEVGLKADTQRHGIAVDEAKSVLATLVEGNGKQAKEVGVLSERVERRNAELVEHEKTIRRRDERIAGLEHADARK